MSKYYHRVRFPKTFGTVLEEGLDPAKRFEARGFHLRKGASIPEEETLIFVSKQPRLWDRRTPELEVEIEEELIRDPELHTSALKPMQTISYEKWYYDLPEWLEENVRQSGVDSDEIELVIEEAKRLRNDGELEEMKAMLSSYLKSSSNEEYDALVGFYATSKKIEPSQIRVAYELFDDPLKIVSMKLGYGDFHSLPPRKIDEQFLDLLLEETGGIDEAMESVNEAFEISPHGRNDYRLKRINKLLKGMIL